MEITCIRCGCGRFKAGEIQPAPQGGFFVVMPCAECHEPNPVLHEYDEDFAKSLAAFFEGSSDPLGDTFFEEMP